MKIDQDILYAPCPCGSGKKFKFCCYQEVRDDLPDNPSMQDVKELVAGPFDVFSNCPGVDKVADRPAIQKAVEGVKAMMRDKDFSNAVDLFHEARMMCPDIIPAWDSEATALWQCAEYEKAAEVQRESLARSGGWDVFGLAQLAEFEYALGNDAVYESYVAKALRMAVRSVHEMSKVCEALALARRHADLFEYATGRGAEMRPEHARFAGVAAANLGKWREARRLIGIALDGDIGGTLLEDIEYELESDDPQSPYPLGEWPYFDLDSYPPLPLAGKPVAERRPEHRNIVCDLAEILLVEGCIDKDDALEAIAPYDGGRASRLRTYLATTGGYCDVDEDEFRKHHSSGDEIAMQKALADLGYEQVELSDEAPTYYRMPDKADYEAFCDATNDLLSFKVQPGTERWEEIRRTLARLHMKYPDHAQCWMNYASMFEREGKPKAARSMVEAIYRIHPGYIFAAAAIAKQALKDDDIKRAGEVLKSFRLPARLHPDAYRMWLRVKMNYCLKVHDEDNLKNTLDALERLASTYGPGQSK